MFAVLLPAAGARAANGEVHLIDRDVDNGLRSEMAISADGYPMIASYNDSIPSIELSICYNHECTRARSATLIRGLYDVDFDLAVGPDGNPVLAFKVAGFRGSVNVLKCSDAFCRRTPTIWQVWSTLVGRVGNVSLDVDALNNPTVVFDWSNDGNDASATTLVSCGDPQCADNDTQWRLGSGRSHDVAIGPNGFPVVALGSVDPFRPMTMEFCKDARCETRKAVLLESNGSIHPRLATDGRYITMVAEDRQRRAERTLCVVGLCTGQQVISDPGVRAVKPNVAYSKRGVAVVSYTDSSRADLWMHLCTSSCSGDRLVQGKAGTSLTRVGMASDDELAFISFFEPTNRQLALATQHVS